MVKWELLQNSNVRQKIKAYNYPPTSTLPSPPQFYGPSNRLPLTHAEVTNGALPQTEQMEIDG